MLKDWLEDLTLFKSIYRFNAISINIPWLYFFSEGEKKNPPIHMEFQGVPNSQNNLKEKKQSERSPSFWFQNILQSKSNQDTVVLIKVSTTN